MISGRVWVSDNDIHDFPALVHIIYNCECKVLCVNYNFEKNPMLCVNYNFQKISNLEKLEKSKEKGAR